MSLATQLGICNQALVKVGANIIQDITENTRTAQILNSIYNQVRDEVLRDHPWRFATKRVVLQPNGQVPLFDFQFTYDLPNDFLRIIEIFPDWQRFIREGNQILADDTSASVVNAPAQGGFCLRYIWMNYSESNWPQDFANAFAIKLAFYISYSLTQSLALKQDLQKDYERCMAEVRFTSGTEGTIKGLEADMWSNSRISYGSWGAWQDNSEGSI